MNKEILRLAIPNILANLSVPLLSIVDVALMGHLGDESYILSIGFGVMIFNFVYWGFGFLRMGVTGMTAQEVGRKDVSESYRLLFRGLFIAFAASILLFIFQGFILQLALFLVDTNQEVSEQITTYFNIRIYAAPATLGLYVFIGWFLGKQNAKIPMVITIALNLLNVAISYYLVTELHMSSDGVAWGTVIAQYSGLLLAIISFFAFFKKQLPTVAFKQVLEMNKMKQFMAVNTDIIVRTLCLIFVLSFFKVQSGKEGDIVGAANMLLLEFLAMAAYGIDGFSFAVEAISGKYFGAKNKIMLNKTIRYCFYWGFGLGFLYAIVYLLFGENVVWMLTNQHLVLEEAMNYLAWLVAFPLVCVVPFIWDGVFIGVTASKAMRNTMLIATFLVFFPTYYLLHHLMGNHSLWLAMLLFIGTRGVAQTIIAKKVVYGRL